MAESRRLYFTPSAQVAGYLRQLARMGIYGKKQSEVITWILGKEIMRLVENGTLKRLSPDEEGAEGDDEA